MFIEPNTVIRFFNNIPLDGTYNHTILFSSASEQQAYFSNPKYTHLANSYQRIVAGKMRVQRKADLLYDCNYLSFQNSNYGNKWFYAFITGVEFLNNETTEVTFEIDVMQTYMFDVSLKQCFVEREHSVTDNVGDNLVAENVDMGDIICTNQSTTGLFDSYTAVIATAYSNTGQTGGYQSGLFSGVNYVAGNINNASEVQALLDFLTSAVEANKADSIISVFIMPTAFYTSGTLPSVQVKSVAKNTTLNGYEPRNKKLLTYPFNYLSVDCGNNDAVYRYEWFADTACNFMLTGCVSCNPQVMLVPENYNGTNGGDFNYVEKLVMSNFPQVAWSVDSFRTWLAQEASSTAIQGIASGVSIAGGAMTGNPMAMASGIFGLSGTINSTVLASNRPPQARGSASGTIDVATRTKDFRFKQMQIHPQYARIIDDYFDLYGYATNRVKIPNRNSRAHWNYVKTSGCVLKGNAPVESVRKICSIYDSGITFWKNASEVGDYSLDNGV